MVVRSGYMELDTATRSTLLRCDRTASSIARDALARTVRGVVSLRPGCLLHPSSDILQGAESAKIRLSASLWQCAVCGKQFEGEHWLDKHLARRHPGLYSGGSVCLSDLCGLVLPCRESLRNVPAVSAILIRRGGTAPKRLRTLPNCGSESERLARRRSCIDLVRNCTPSANAAIHKYLNTRLCDAAWAVECELSTSSELEHARLPLGERIRIAKWPLWFLFGMMLSYIILKLRLRRLRLRGERLPVWLQKKVG